MEELIRQVANLQKQVDGLVKPEVPLGLSLIAETVLSGSVTSVDFSSIPQGFRNLMFMGQVRSDRVAELDTAFVRFNGDSGNNYDYSQVQNAVFGTTLAGTIIPFALIEAASSRASCFSFVQLYLPGYARTDAEKYTYGLGGAFGNLSAAGDLFFFTSYGHWRDTSAITSISVDLVVGPNYVSGSRFQLYGIA